MAHVSAGLLGSSDSRLHDQILGFTLHAIMFLDLIVSTLFPIALSLGLGLEPDVKARDTAACAV